MNEIMKMNPRSMNEIMTMLVRLGSLMQSNPPDDVREYIRASIHAIEWATGITSPPEYELEWVVREYEKERQASGN